MFRRHTALLEDDVKPFDPSQPAAPADFHDAVSPFKNPSQPDGNGSFVRIPSSRFSALPG